MDDSETKIRELSDKIQQLEGRINTLSEGMTRLAKGVREYDGLLDQQAKMIEKSVEDAFGRIINIELKVFPNLAADIDQLHNIIGDTRAQPESSFERRKP